MPTKFESILARKDKFITLGEVFTEANIINPDFGLFFSIFGKNIKKVCFDFVEYGIINGSVENNVTEDVPVFLRRKNIDEVIEYIGSDGYICYSLSSNHMMYQDYKKVNKRKDLITKIYILDRNYPVRFEACNCFNPKTFEKLKVMCTVGINGIQKRGIDLFDYWTKFNNSDEIIINEILEPKEPFIENLTN